MERIAWLQNKAIRDVCKVLTAGQISPSVSGSGVGGISAIEKIIQVETSLRVPKIDVMGREQSMSLRTDVAYGGDHIFRDLALNADVVLLGVLRLQLFGHLPEEQNGTEVRPVDRCSRRRRQESIERVGNGCIALKHERRLEEPF